MTLTHIQYATIRLRYFCGLTVNPFDAHAAHTRRVRVIQSAISGSIARGQLDVILPTMHRNRVRTGISTRACVRLMSPKKQLL